MTVMALGLVLAAVIAPDFAEFGGLSIQSQESPEVLDNWCSTGILDPQLIKTLEKESTTEPR